MLPGTAGRNILQQDFQIEQLPTKTFRIQENQVIGYVDGLEAVKQSVYCILNTERYDWMIYSWNYGVELKGLLGKPMGFVKSKLKKRITEALMQDDRIQSVDAFSFDIDGRRLEASFTVHSIFGEIQGKKEVNV